MAEILTERQILGLALVGILLSVAITTYAHVCIYRLVRSLRLEIASLRLQQELADALGRVDEQTKAVERLLKVLRVNDEHT